MGVMGIIISTTTVQGAHSKQDVNIPMLPRAGESRDKLAMAVCSEHASVFKTIYLTCNISFATATFA